MQICRMFSLLNVFRRSIWAMNQLSLYDNTLVPLFLQLIGSYCSPVVLYIYFRSELRRKFKPTDSLKVVCVCVGVCERAMWTSRWMGMTELVCVCVYLMMSMCPFLAARCRGDVPLGSVVSPFLGSSRAAHMLLDNNNWTTYTHTHTESTSNTYDHFCRLPSAAAFFFFFN